MGIELPQDLVGVAQAAGVQWPQADEDKMRQAAQAWRDAGTKLDTLVTDSDKTARTTLTHMQGDAGESATKNWSTFVAPDTGHLTATAKGCTAAADRLEHAADQVGVAKTEIVRQLVALASNTDAAHAAAASGHPTALAGLDTFVKGTAANVATINHSLVDAVRPGSGVDVSATQPPAHAGPGEHATSLVSNLTGGATTLVGHTTHGATTLVDPGQGSGHHGPVANLAQGATNLVDGTVQGVTGPVDGTAQGATNLVDPGQGHGHHGVVGDTVQGATNLVDGTAQGAANVVDPGHGHGHGVVGDVAQGAANLVDPGPIDHATAGDITAGDTGPIPVQHPDAPTPRSGLGHPVNQVVAAAGLADAPPIANLPGNAAPVAGPFPAPSPAPAPGYLGGGPVGGGLPFGGAPIGGAPIGTAAPVGGPSPVGGPAPIGGQPGAIRGPVAGPFAGNPGGPIGAGLGNESRGPAPIASPQPMPPAAPAALPAAPLPPGHKTEREQLVAVLLVHMFPIGHMPVAASEPARQLPVPPPEIDYAAGMRFAPDDHPLSHLVGIATPPEQVPVVEALTSESEPVQELLAGHDTLGDLHERDWDRKFLVRPAGPQGDVEYAWPPGELYPEGGTAPGEAEVLGAGTLIDRFGREDGRVFAAAETPFAQRSLPPSHVDLEYRRYRVVEPIPVWRSLSAAWFAQPGGGTRYRTTRSVAELVALGHLADVTREAEEGTP